MIFDHVKIEKVGSCEGDRCRLLHFLVASLAENDIKTNATQSDINLLKNTFERIAKSYKEITGNTTLNSVGDRKYGEYNFWAIRDCNNDGGDNH